MQAPILTYLFWRLAIYIYLLLFESIRGRFYWAWVRFWDSGHYISIAQNGYHFPQQAFFPLWPLLISLLAKLGPSAYLSSFLLTNILGLTTFITFYLLAKTLIGEEKAKMSLLVFACFPATMFLLASYSEGLFLTLSISSFLLLQQKKYALASLLAGFTSGTRVVGLALSAIFLFNRKPLLQKLLLVGFSLSGLFAYMYYLDKLYKNPFYFLQAEKDWCLSAGRCGLIFPLVPIRDFLEKLLAGKIAINLSPTFLDGFFSIIFLLLLIKVYEKLGIRYFIYSILVILLPLSSDSLVGMGRYILAAFPVFIILPTTVKNKLLFLLICCLLFLLQLRFIHLFIHLQWVD